MLASSPEISSRNVYLLDVPVDDLRSGTWVTYIGGRATSCSPAALPRRGRPAAPTPAWFATSKPRSSASARAAATTSSSPTPRSPACTARSGSTIAAIACAISTRRTAPTSPACASTTSTSSRGAQIALGSTRLKFEPLGESVEIELADTDRFGSMIGRSVKMRELFARLEKLARTDTTVLVTGETGVGKELVAEALHDSSPREKGPFVVLDCGSIPPNLIESELFGHERGAFTGATNIVRRRVRARPRRHRVPRRDRRAPARDAAEAPARARAQGSSPGRRHQDDRGRRPRRRRDQPRPRRRGQPRPVPRGSLLPARRRARARAAAARAQGRHRRC